MIVFFVSGVELTSQFWYFLIISILDFLNLLPMLSSKLFNFILKRISFLFVTITLLLRCFKSLFCRWKLLCKWLQFLCLRWELVSYIWKQKVWLISLFVFGIELCSKFWYFLIMSVLKLSDFLFIWFSKFWDFLIMSVLKLSQFLFIWFSKFWDFLSMSIGEIFNWW